MTDRGSTCCKASCDDKGLLASFLPCLECEVVGKCNTGLGASPSQVSKVLAEELQCKIACHFVEWIIDRAGVASGFTSL